MSKLSRRNAMSALLALGAVLPAATAKAANTEDKFAKPYTQADFDAAQAAGKSILVAVHAHWCPTCRAQEPILDGLFSDPKFKGIVALRVDYDGQKDVCTAFQIHMQSTLIGFKGKEEVKRSVGDTSADGIYALLASLV